MYILGVAGGSGSGKTTFAHKIIDQLGDYQEDLALLSMDSYYLAEQPKESYGSNGKPNFDHPKAFDWELLHFHLKALKEGMSIQVPVYDFGVSKRLADQSIPLSPKKVLIFEGIFTLFNEDVRNLIDTKCFLNVDADIRFIRRLHRDIEKRNRSMESVISQYYGTVRPMYQKYLDPQKQFADIIVGEETDSAAEIISCKIKEVIRKDLFSAKFNPLKTSEDNIEQPQH